ncbi:hypothetical protein M413DRAFT_64505 [Hebeloma cylindrosporum]|uniref:Methionine--tRNA ligase, mitochondrial n=1 Tax=Hebeloma cylindrosporum TaxID=76867 RepID=A0A0C3CQW7_HEBCY|nr:hypothetical protein M413DRAFT_64505 [Hebeloma cylindrosporum h7]
MILRAVRVPLLGRGLGHAALLPTCSRRSIHSLSNSTDSTKPFYITTPIFYPNAAPHIGHLYSLVAADVIARHQRQRRPNRDDSDGVVFLAGTDEHGMKIQKAAAVYFDGQAGREQEFCDRLSERFRDLAERAGVSNSCFMRTTMPEHKEVVMRVWRILDEKGYIYKGKYEGWYSVTDECFYTDSQVVFVPASSPSSSPPAEPMYKSIETSSPVTWVSEENYMFRLSAFREALLHHYTHNKSSVFPEQYRLDVIGMLEDQPGGAQALEDISISRPRSRLSWGVPVPGDDHLGGQTVYVWFDALLIYLTGSGYPWELSSTKNTASSLTATRTGTWPPNVQVIGKDILRFHAIYLPAILMALSAPHYTTLAGSSTVQPKHLGAPQGGIPLAQTLLTHAHWTSDGQKMSKSIGNVVDPIAVMEEWGADVVRFYLIRVGGRWASDVDWSTPQLTKHKHEIESQLGNYFLRVASPKIFARSEDRESDDGIAVNETENVDPNHTLLKLTLALEGKVDRHMERLEAGLALNEVMNLLKTANKTLTDIAPWSASTPPHLVHTTRIVALETVRVVARCLAPFMPGVGAKLSEALGGEDVSRVAGATTGKTEAEKEMERFWRRWSGRDVKGVRLF